jgi:exodeoxyribonuclease VII large subunit
MPPIMNNSFDRQAITLSELNRQVRAAIQEAMPGIYWLRAETSDVRVNHTSGHCYLEFIEKDQRTGQLLAKARASIWAKTFALLKPFFERETGQSFVSGLTVMVKVAVDFHELYGFSLTVYDIDPAYTLGDMARKRLEIVKRLQEEGIFGLNKELAFPSLPRRIAVITSPTAAGYEDFMKQLLHNAAGFPFYVKLFPAWMQGDKTEASVISALDRIYACADCFDVVVIIRGGGATSDLSCFDSYLLAANCAQFPLPIVTGIGHERDETVLDMVAHTRMKTPTAVAELFIGCLTKAAEAVDSLSQSLIALLEFKLNEQKNEIQYLASKLPGMVLNRLEKSRSIIQALGSKLPTATVTLLADKRSSLKDLYRNIQRQSTELLAEKQRYIQLTEQFVKMASPDYILKRGYTLTLKDGKIMKSVSQLESGETVITRFADGEMESRITEVHNK